MYIQKDEIATESVLRPIFSNFHMIDFENKGFNTTINFILI